MKDKITIIILTIVFIGLLIGLNFFLKEETNKKLNGDNIQINKNIDGEEISNENISNESINNQNINNNNVNNENNENKEEKKVNILKVTGKNFEEEVLKSEKPVLIDFYAEWCGPCKIMAPIMEKVAESNENIKIVKINVDEAQDIAMKYKIMSIPTLVVIKDGKEAKRSVGLIGQADIEKLIK